jgi:hypothetical protein
LRIRKRKRKKRKSMSVRTLEEINKKYEGFVITGRVEYNDESYEAICHLSATKNGFDKITKSGHCFSKVFSDLQWAIDDVVAAASREKGAKTFALIPLSSELAFDGTMEKFTKTKHGWENTEDSDEEVTVLGKVWEIYVQLWVPIPVPNNVGRLSAKVAKQLSKLTAESQDVAAAYVLKRAKEILKG